MILKKNRGRLLFRIHLAKHTAHASSIPDGRRYAAQRKGSFGTSGPEELQEGLPAERQVLGREELEPRFILRPARILESMKRYAEFGQDNDCAC